MNHRTQSLTFLTLAATTLAFSLAACSKKDVQKPVPTPIAMVEPVETVEAEPTPVPALPTPEPTMVPNSYIIQPGDSLWRVSGDPVVFGDSFRWPLLFKANRDQIIDPDLVEPAQDLTWKQNYDPEVVKDAVSKAQETPPYVPHAKPRKALPLKY